jgi:hypothetical protein
VRRLLVVVLLLAGCNDRNNDRKRYETAVERYETALIEHRSLSTEQRCDPVRIERLAKLGFNVAHIHSQTGIGERKPLGEYSIGKAVK